MQSFIAALYANGKCVTGSNHGDAFSKLKERDKDGCTSGFLDQHTGKFIADDKAAFFMKQIFCIRHAEYSTPFLTAKGLTQARHAAEFLSQLDLTEYSAFASPYRRCQQTAAIIGAFTGLRFLTLDWLGEQAGQETLADLKKRVETGIESLPEKNILITHFDVIVEAVQIATGQTPLDNWRIPHASVTYLDRCRSVWVGRQIKGE